MGDKRESSRDWIAHAEDMHGRGMAAIMGVTPQMRTADATVCRQFAETMFAAAQSAAMIAVAIRAEQG